MELLFLAVQAQLFAACETVASLLLLLPMATGGLQLSFRLYINHLEVGNSSGHVIMSPRINGGFQCALYRCTKGHAFASFMSSRGHGSMASGKQLADEGNIMHISPAVKD